MSIFSDLTQISSATVDAVMAEKLRLVPMTSGGHKAAAVDDNRSSLDTEGVYRELAARTKLDTSSVGRDLNQEVLAPEVTFSCDVENLTGFVFRKKDRIIRLERPGQPTFEIVACEPDGGSRLSFSVVAVNA